MFKLKRIAPIFALIALGAALITIKQRNNIPIPTKQDGSVKDTGLVIINGNREPSDWFAGPTKTEFLNNLIDEVPHIFITPQLWHIFCSYRSEQLKKLKPYNVKNPYKDIKVDGYRLYFNKKKKEYVVYEKPFDNISLVLVFNPSDWDFFDTRKGLFYLRHKDAASIDFGIKTDQFSLIKDPFALPKQKTNEQWMDDFMNFFDLAKWRRYHSQTGAKKFIQISGHGTSSKMQNNRLCGMNAPEFVKLAAFFNNDLQLDFLAVETCFWSSSRILELLKKDGNFPKVNFHLLTPIDREQISFARATIPHVQDYDPENYELVLQTHPTYTFYTGLEKVVPAYSGALTQEIKEVIESIEDVVANHSHGLKTALIDAGSKTQKLI